MNGSTTTLNGNAVNGTNGALNGIGSAPRTATLGTPNSYAYTSSGSLLGRGGSARPVPPPTLPKYSGSFNAGSSINAPGLRERDREGTGGSHRLASLERLALRQRIIEQSANNQVASLMANNNGTNGGLTSATVTLTDTATLQSKRELFFKSETVSGGGVSATGLPTSAPPAPPLASSALKEALAKRSATLPDPPENSHHEANGTTPATKLSNSVSVDAGKINSMPPQMPAPPVPTNAPPSITAPLRSTENIMKKSEHPPVAPKPDLPKIEKPKTKELDGYVGFANLPNQVYRKAVKKGFEFTLMVVGETGLGKSTLINSLFLTEVYDKDKHPGPSLRVKKTVGVETSLVLLKENGVNLTLTIVDTPGFGDAVDNSNCWQPIIDFVESKYEEFLNAESRVSRKAAPADSRVHCCLYFIAPSGHGLKPLDVEFMQRLGDKVNIIPVIAKADTMTPEECKDFKDQILKEIAQHKIKIYEFPESSCEEGEGAEGGRGLRARVPFAVVGANTVIEQDGRRVRGRKYPWGVAEVENLEHCDFLALRNMVIRTHLQDLKDVTSSVHYENYRCRKLAGLTHDGQPHGLNSNKNPLAQMEEEKREHDLKMKKMECEMEQVFEQKAREKHAKLKESEAELARRHEATRRALEAQARDLDDRLRTLRAEQAAWERDTGLSLDDLRRRSLEANSRETVDGKDKKDKKKKGVQQKAREKHAKLKESEAELARRHEATRRALEAQARDLDDRLRTLRAEQAAWERDTGLSLDDLRRRSLEANSRETVDGKDKKDKKKKGVQQKAREKHAKLKESEAELARRHEATRRALEAQARDLDDRLRTLRAEQAAWERDTGLSLDDLRRRSLEANSRETVDGKDKKDKKKKGVQQKAREKHAKLKESEAELARRHEATRRALEAQARDLDDRLRTLRAEQAAWERDTGLSLDDLRRRSLEANSRETVDGKDKKDKKKKDWSFKNVTSGISV